jgi:3-dehydroquinate dehydratase-1
MAPRKSVKRHRRSGCQIVGVITTRTEFCRALRMSPAPDLFELRLDHLVRMTDYIERRLSMLPARVIITARHPAEGGANNLPLARRRELLLRFLPRARAVDVELRSVRGLQSVIASARKNNVQCIFSYHDLKSTPTARSLRTKARTADRLRADVFKVATRTDAPTQLERLLDFTAHKDVDLAVSVMGIGRLGALSRVILPRLGSVLAYAPVGRAQLQGQLSIAELRSSLSRSR